MRQTRPLLLFFCILLVPACTVEVSSPNGAPPSQAAEEGSGTSEELEPLDDVSIEQVDAPLEHSTTSEIVADALPSIVNVRVTALTSGILGTREGKGQGSGVIIDKQGVILTNAHVVQDATEVSVVFNKETGLDPMDGTVLGISPERDLAVVRVDAQNLDPIELGRSESVHLGDSLIAIGYPLGLGGATVTQGILSAEDRTIRVRGADGEALRFSGLLQTDAAINPGNSGGGLLDTNGRLVGINSAAAPAAAAENIGFAIAIDAALPVIEDILNEPVEERAWLGVSVSNVTAEARDEYDLRDDVRGALILEVLSGSPAEDSGLEIGEVITAIDDTELTTSGDLIDTLADLEPGTEVELSVTSEDGSRTVEAELIQRPPQFGDPDPTPRD